MQPDELESYLPVDPDFRNRASAFVNGVIVALNWLYGVRPDACQAPRRTAAQCEALRIIVTAAIALAERLSSVGRREAEHTWSSFEAGGISARLDLDAELVGVPDVAGTCDPLSLVPSDTASCFASAASVFPCTTDGLDRFPGFYAGARSEYVKLTIAQLRAGMLRLSSWCKGGGTVFPVQKHNGRQRVVWHGSRVSMAAARLRRRVIWPVHAYSGTSSSKTMSTFG